MPDEQPGGSPAAEGAAGHLDPRLGALPATVWLTDDRLRFTFVQGHLLRRLELDPGRVIGRSLQEILVDGREDHPIIQNHLTALAGHETSLRIEWGGTLYHARIAPLHDAAGQVVGCAGVLQQIGWRADDEGTLHERDVRLRRIIDSNMIGIAFGHADGHITDANEAFLQLAGYTREDLIQPGIWWPDLTPIEAHERQMRAIDEIRETGRCTPFEIELIRKDGDRVPVLVGGARLAADRQEGVAFVLDISDRRHVLTRVRAELACADAVAAGPLGDGALALLEALCEPLGWKAAALFVAAADSTCHLAVSQGIAPGARESLDELAARALNAEDALWFAEAETLAVPLRHAGRPLGALILVGRTTGRCDRALIDTCRRIADRIAKRMGDEQT